MSILFVRAHNWCAHHLYVKRAHKPLWTVIARYDNTGIISHLSNHENIGMPLWYVKGTRICDPVQDHKMDVCAVCSCREALNCANRGIQLRNYVMTQSNIWKEQVPVVRDMRLEGNMFLPTYGVSTNSIYVINATLNDAMCEARSTYPPNVHVVTDACTSSRAEAHDAETPTEGVFAALIVAYICLVAIVATGIVLYRSVFHNYGLL